MSMSRIKVILRSRLCTHVFLCFASDGFARRLDLLLPGIARCDQPDDCQQGKAGILVRRRSRGSSRWRWTVVLLSGTGRIGSQGLFDDARWSVYGFCIDAIRQRPLLGSGVGTFADLFPSLRTDDFSTWGVWDYAHSTILEIAVEMGIPIAAMVVIAARRFTLHSCSSRAQVQRPGPQFAFGHHGNCAAQLSAFDDRLLVANPRLLDLVRDTPRLRTRESL